METKRQKCSEEERDLVYTLEIASKQYYLEVKQLKTNKQLSIKDTEINSRESVEVIEVGLFPHQQI